MGLNSVKNIKIFIVSLTFFLIVSSFLSANVYSLGMEEQQVNRVISLVFDDSGSMVNDNQDYDYASYALQNIIGVMNWQDELGVVKLSNVNEVIIYDNSDYEKRSNNILEVKKYSEISQATDFVAIHTAANYLKEKKKQHGNDLDYRYYLVVITDGKFDNYPKDLSRYLADLRNNFVNSYFKSVFIGIGDDLQPNLEKDVLSNDNYYFIRSKGKDGIVKAVFDAHDIIYNRETISENELSLRNDGKTLSFYAEKDIKRILIHEQDQQSKVSSISSKDICMDKLLTFSTSKSKSPYLKSYIIHSEKTRDAIPYGNVVIDLEELIEKSANKLRVMVEYGDANIVDKVVETAEFTKPTNSIDPTSSIGQTSPTELTSPIDPMSPIDSTGPTKAKRQGTEEYKHVTKEEIVCVCPISRFLLLIFLGGLLKSIVDRRRNKKNYENLKLSNSDNYETYKFRDDYYKRRKKKFLFLALLMLLLIILCHIFLCKYNFIDCIRHCCLLKGCNKTVISVATVEPIAPVPIATHSIVSQYVSPIAYKLLPIAPFIALALILGYIFKNRFDTRFHAFEKNIGNELEKSAAIKVNRWTKFVPYISETGYGNDIFIKASKKKDRVIIPKKYLTEDMQRDGQKINLKSDFALFEDIPFTREVNGIKYTYIYKSYKKFEKNT